MAMLGKLGPSHNLPRFLPTSTLAFRARSPGHTCGYTSLYVQVLATPQAVTPSPFSGVSGVGAYQGQRLSSGGQAWWTGPGSGLGTV